MSALDLSTLSKFSEALRRLPVVVAIKIAERAAPILSELAHATANAGEDPYGVPWAPGVDGQTVTLRKSGDMLRPLAYIPRGPKLRASLTTRYAKYQLGKRTVFPRQGGLLPSAYSEALKVAVVDVCREELGR